MNKYYALLMFLILVTIIPTLPKPVESLTKVDLDFRVTVQWEYLAYRALYGNYVYATAQTVSPFNATLVVVKPDGTVKTWIGAPYLDKTPQFQELSIDGNDTFIAMAYRAFIVSGNSDIYVAFFDYDANPRGGVIIDQSPGLQGLPVIKYGGGYWLVSYVDNVATGGNGNLRFIVYDLRFTEVHSGSIFIDYDNTADGDAGVDYRERAFYSTVTGRFYQVFWDKNTRDLRLLIVDPVARSHRVISITTDGAAQSECWARYGRLYRRCYAQISSDDRYIGVIYGYRDGHSPNVNFAIIDLVNEQVVRTVNLATVGGNTNIWPRVTAGDNEWFVAWYRDTIYREQYVAVVKQDGSFISDKIPVPSGYDYVSGYVGSVYTGTDYLVIFSARKGANDDSFAMRINSALRKSPVPFVISNTTGYNETFNYPLIISDNVTVLYARATGTGSAHRYGAVALFNYTEVMEPYLTPTQFTSTAVAKDTGVDTYLEPGDEIRVIARLVDDTGAPVAGRNIDVSLINVIWWNSRISREETYTIVATSTNTNSTGWIDLTIELPSAAPEGVYRVDLLFRGDLEYSGASWKSPHFIVTRVKPIDVTWESVPGDLATGPAMLVKNGQAIITDPLDEVKTHHRFGTYMTDIIGNEVDDVDIKLLQFAIDSNYLYIKAEFAGNVEPIGNVAPVLSIAIDFTPHIKDDGPYYRYTYAGTPITIARMEVVYNLGFTDTYLKGNSTWNWMIVASPVGWRDYIFKDDYDRYTIFSWIGYKHGVTYYYYEIGSGFAIFSGNRIEIYAPLELIKPYYPDLFTKPVWNWRVYAAVFGVNLVDNKLIGLAGSNWFDVPGIVTLNSTPTNPIDIGFVESFVDDRVGYDYELDTFFILNINRTNNRFFGYTALSLDSVEAAGQIFNTGVPYLGSHIYRVRIIDANNTRYTVYGEVVEFLIGTSVVSSAPVSRYDNKLYARIKYFWSEQYLNTNQTITIRYRGSSDYYPASPITQRIGPFKYYIEVRNATVDLIQNNPRPGVEAGDIIVVTIYTEVWGDENFTSPPLDLGLFDVYLNSTPYYLGKAVVIRPGVALLNYTVTGHEWIVSESPEHYILIYIDETYGHAPYYIELDFPYTLNMTIYTLLPPPVPEPGVLPVIILVALIAAILFIKRK